MKVCPICKKEYFDDTLEFCLDDGSRLKREHKLTGETLTAASIRPEKHLTQAETVQISAQPGKRGLADLPKTEALPNPPFSDRQQRIKSRAADVSVKILEISPIVFALAHNYWQWLYLTRFPTYDLAAFFTSYVFLIWIFLLCGGLLFGLFSLKYGHNKGFAITALVVLAINMILSIVPK